MFSVMRCPMNEKGEEINSLSGWSIWSTNFFTPNLVQTVDNSCGLDVDSTTDRMPNICILDSASSSQKRKMLDCEKEDFEGRFYKIQRKKQLQRAAARASLIIDNSDDEEEEEDFDEDKIYEEMDWIEYRNEKESLSSWVCDEIDMSFGSIERESPLLSLHKLKWREERRRLLKISMAKIQDVEDPEAYLRRSVLINNTVKKLQKDTLMNYKFHSVCPPSFEYDLVEENESNIWKFEGSNLNILSKEPEDLDVLSQIQYSLPILSDAVSTYNYSDQIDLAYNTSHLSLNTFSSDKLPYAFQPEISQSVPCFNKNVDRQILNDTSSCSRMLKQSSVHIFSSQPCGLQYRNPIHSEDENGEYKDSSSSSSVLDSVVYHSLIASLES